MKTIGFIKSELSHEDRRALLPKHIRNIRNKSVVFIEEGYGEVLGIPDKSYKREGVRIVSRCEALSKDIICDLKIGVAGYLNRLTPKQTLFGWVHAGSDSELVDVLLDKKFKVIAWEEMFKNGRHVFWKNNQLAGEAAILHAFTLFGKLPDHCRVALLGRGNVSMGAHKMLSALGAEVKIFNRDTIGNLPNELGSFDMLVNGILWDKSRDDHILYQEDLKKFKQPAMIVDISADKAGAIESSHPTSFAEPTYTVDGVIHYVVNHTPSIFNYSASESISAELSHYIDSLIEEKAVDHQILADAIIINDGRILDEKIKQSIHIKP